MILGHVTISSYFNLHFITTKLFSKNLFNQAKMHNKNRLYVCGAFYSSDFKIPVLAGKAFQNLATIHFKGTVSRTWQPRHGQYLRQSISRDLFHIIKGYKFRDQFECFKIFIQNRIMNSCGKQQNIKVWTLLEQNFKFMKFWRSMVEIHMKPKI